MTYRNSLCPYSFPPSFQVFFIPFPPFFLRWFLHYLDLASFPGSIKFGRNVSIRRIKVCDKNVKNFKCLKPSSWLKSGFL